MANFDAQVIELVGSSWTEDQDAVNQFITEGANEVINAMPRSMQERIAEETAVTSGTTTSEGHKVISMTRNDGTIDQPCRLIPAWKRGRAADSSDMEYATATDPVYYTNDGKFNILPSGGSGNKLVSVPTYSQSSVIDASNAATITNFPNEAEYLVVLYAAVKALQQVMNGKSSSLPTDITLPSSPVAPAISTVSYTDATASGVVVPAKIDVSGNAPTFVSPADFSKVTSYIETDEDTELAVAKIQQINSQLDEALNKFNKENVRYQVEYQEEAMKVNQDLQAELEVFKAKTDLNARNAAKQIEDVIADNGSKIQKYSSELQRYQSEVASEIQNYNAKIQKQVTDYQWIVSQHQNLSADYQRGLQLLTGARAS